MLKVLREIGKILRALETIANIEFKAINLHKGQYLFLNRICENPGIINDDLAKMTRIDRTTVAKSVKNLQTIGLVTKEKDSQNKKVRRLYVTDKGKELYNFLDREEKYSENNALKGLSEEEKEELLRLLKIVEKNIFEDLNYVLKGNKRIY